MDTIIQKFEEMKFIKCLTSFLALYYVYTVPFPVKIEKMLGFIMETISFTGPLHYEKTRSVQYLKLCKSLTI